MFFCVGCWNYWIKLNIFDIIYYNGEKISHLPFKERRKIIEKIIQTIKLKIRPSFQIITNKESQALKFYQKALKTGEEGIMIKNLKSPYRPGRRVGYMVKMKPEAKDLDFVIVKAEYFK